MKKGKDSKVWKHMDNRLENSYGEAKRIMNRDFEGDEELVFKLGFVMGVGESMKEIEVVRDSIKRGLNK